MNDIQSISANSVSVDKYDDVGNSGLYGGSSMDAIAQINELIIKLAEGLKKLRNILQEFNQKQQELGWNIQASSLDKKRQGIEDAYDAAKLTGAFQIVSGSVGVLNGAFAKQFGEIATHFGQATSKGLEGSGQLGSAEMTKKAELEKVEGDFQAMNAQNYAKNIKDSWDKACQLSEQVRSIVKDLVDLYTRISSAVVNK
ncbi:Secreted effector protein SseD [Arsenophonus endosymbiont of Aleurodicus floccissimus]|uniref:pathogenicity island effector protein n=1 Tax=Arsenophonus endosymbiont of Aleurodicus floccissimus TaxID=2152761 RepID=UPI000E6AED3B|nr:pathogenicity island effector protein [Arsenophonus endosymbiont of Aleurodicus floccissimus]SPP32167.1 Secreted effector protein SseD [Arsenophonus endosymbiont of Aleurodicus floccissimus]